MASHHAWGRDGVPKGRGHVLALRAALVAVLTLGQMKLVRGKTRAALGRRRARERQRGLPRHPMSMGVWGGQSIAWLDAPILLLTTGPRSLGVS